MGSTKGSPYRRRSCFPDLPTKTSSRPEPRSHSSVISVVFFAGARCLSAGHHLRLPVDQRGIEPQPAVAQLLVLCNCTAVHNQLLQHGFQTAWLGRLRVTTTSSAAGATARIAVIVQTGCGFLSGGRRGASVDDREDCYGRATVALTRAIQHTYILSPLDMAGMIGMAQTLAVYHYGIIPQGWTDTVSWTGDCPIWCSSSLGLGSWYPIYIAWQAPPCHRHDCHNQWGALFATVPVSDCPKVTAAPYPEVLATFASHGRDHRLTASGFFPCSIDREYLYGYAADGYRSPLWLCATTETRY